MIHEIGVELGKLLVGVKCPLPVVDGPERPKPTTFGRERIVLEYDEDGNDAFAPVRGNHENPKHRATVRWAGKITIYAQSAKAGAREFEHNRRALLVRDLVFVAIEEIAKDRKNAWSVTGGGFKPIEDLVDSERRGGAKYELKFWFERGLMVQTFEREIAPANEIGSVTNTTSVTRAGASEDATPEVGCGG